MINNPPVSSGAALPYTEYVCRVSTDAAFPTVLLVYVISNTTGLVFTWTRIDVGRFSVTIPGGFNPLKTVFFQSSSVDGNPSEQSKMSIANGNIEFSVFLESITVYVDFTADINWDPADGELSGGVYISIRIYP
jgi:hypothetical protein